jgi:hypothetical protein
VTTPLNAFRQGIFDIVVERGSAMTNRCIDEMGSCAYRDGKGGACYVGLIMSDEEATDKNGKTHTGGVDSLKKDGVLPARYHDHLDLLGSLQWVHDNYSNWEDTQHPETGRTLYGYGPPKRALIASELRQVAQLYGLDAKSVDIFYPA